MIKYLICVWKYYIIGCDHQYEFKEYIKQIDGYPIVDFLVYKKYVCKNCKHKKYKLYKVNGIVMDNE